MKKEAYIIYFNDFGRCVAITDKGYSYVEKMFMELKYGGDNVRVTKIEKLEMTNEPII